MVNHVFDRRKSQFSLSRSLQDKFCNNDYIKYFESLSIARVDWRSLSNKNDILQSCDNLFQYAKSRHIYNTRYASKQNFCKPCISTNIGKQMFSYKAIDLWHDIPLYLKDLSTFSFAKEVKQYLLSKQYFQHVLGITQ